MLKASDDLEGIKSSGSVSSMVLCNKCVIDEWISYLIQNHYLMVFFEIWYVSISILRVNDEIMFWCEFFETLIGFFINFINIESEYGWYMLQYIFSKFQPIVGSTLTGLEIVLNFKCTQLQNAFCIIRLDPPDWMFGSMGNGTELEGGNHPFEFTPQTWLPTFISWTERRT